jgi:hypothetical protein
MFEFLQWVESGHSLKPLGAPVAGFWWRALLEESHSA